MTTTKGTVYFHIGSPKTGTSSIQAFMTKYNRELRNDGVMYPIVGRSHNGVDRKSTVFINASGYLTENLQAHHRSILSAMEQMEATKVLVSDEAIFLNHDQFLAGFADYVTNQNYNFKVIVYLKSSFQYLCDLWKEKVRGETMITSSLTDFLEHYDYGKNLQAIHRFGEMFGKENLIIRTFEPNTWKNNDVIQDILDQMGITPVFADIEKTKIPSNKGALRKQTEKFRYLNSFFGQLPQERRLQVESIRMDLVKPAENDVSVARSVPSELVKAVCDKYHPYESSIAQTFLERDELFQNRYPDLSKQDETFDTELSEQEHEELHRMVSLISSALALRS